MTTVTIDIPDKEKDIVLQMLKKFNVKIKTIDESPYDPEFVAMIKKGDEDIKQGKGIKIDINDLWK